MIGLLWFGENLAGRVGEDQTPEYNLSLRPPGFDPVSIRPFNRMMERSFSTAYVKTLHPSEFLRECIRVRTWEVIPPFPSRRFCLLTAGYAPAPPPVRRRRPSWAAAPATYLLVGINCAVFLAMVLKGERRQSHRGSADAVGRGQRRRRAARRRVVAHRHRHVCARGHSAPGHQHVVPVEPGSAGRAADGFGGRAGGLLSYRRGRQPAVHAGQLDSLP